LHKGIIQKTRALPQAAKTAATKAKDAAWRSGKGKGEFPSLVPFLPSLPHPRAAACFTPELKIW
jgi:hypothetical protein